MSHVGDLEDGELSRSDEEESLEAEGAPAVESGGVNEAWQWDDRSLVRAWDIAMASYRAEHGNRDWKTHSAPDIEPELEPAPTESKPSSSSSGSKRDRAEFDGGDEEEILRTAARDREEARASKRPRTEEEVPSSLLSPPPVPSGLDASLERLLQAWYWAGYCAAQFELSRQ